MNVLRIPEAVGFEERTREFLLAREAENNLMLGITDSLVKDPPQAGEERFFWVVMDGLRVAGAALWTPSFKPVITRMEDEAVSALLTGMAACGTPLNGVSGPIETSTRFAGLWKDRSGADPRFVMRMWIRALTAVSPVEPRPGCFRKAVPDDLPWVVDWMRVFHEEVRLNEPVDVRKMAGEYIRDGRFFYWESGGRPVSCAGFVGAASGGRVNAVYTPDDERGKGYSKACVSALCRYLLAKGAKTCYLFSDSGNLVSNAVYDRVGFRTVCEWAMYEFPA